MYIIIYNKKKCNVFGDENENCKLLDKLGQTTI